MKRSPVEKRNEPRQLPVYLIAAKASASEVFSGISASGFPNARKQHRNLKRSSKSPGLTNPGGRYMIKHMDNGVHLGQVPPDERFFLFLCVYT